MTNDFPLHHICIEPEDDGPSRGSVVVLHGRGTDEQDLVPLVRHIADDLRILSLRAPHPLGPGYTWYDLDLSGGGLHASQPDEEDFERSLALLDAFVDRAIEHYDLDRRRIGLLGFSQGAILSLGAMIERAGFYAWVVGLHGYLPTRYDDSEIRQAKETPVFLGAGTRDEVIPATRAEEAAQRLDAAGVDVTFRTYRTGHGTAPPEIDDVNEWLRARIERLERS